MSYTMRFLLTDGAAPTLEAIEGMLKQHKPAYSIAREPGSTIGDFIYRDDVYAEIATNPASNEETAQELAELSSTLSDAEEGDQAAVDAVLKKATAVVAVEFPSEDEASGMSLDIVNPVWQWLFANRAGLLQADGDGYYDKNGKILSFPQAGV